MDLFTITGARPKGSASLRRKGVSATTDVTLPKGGCDIEEVKSDRVGAREIVAS